MLISSGEISDSDAFEEEDFHSKNSKEEIAINAVDLKLGIKVLYFTVLYV
jgi:hypothetical protein